MIQTPKHLNDNGKRYWQTLKPFTTTTNKEVVAVLCQVYADYLDTLHPGADLKRQKGLLEIFCKLVKDLGIIGPKQAKSDDKPTLISMLKKAM